MGQEGETQATLTIPDAVVDRLADQIGKRLGVDESGYLTGADRIAGFMGCSRERVYNLSTDEASDFPSFRQGGRLMVAKAELRRWIEEQS